MTSPRSNTDVYCLLIDDVEGMILQFEANSNKTDPSRCAHNSPLIIVMHSKPLVPFVAVIGLTLDTPSLSNRTGLLLLCEVAARPFYERTHAVGFNFI